MIRVDNEVRGTFVPDSPGRTLFSRQVSPLRVPLARRGQAEGGLRAWGPGWVDRGPMRSRGGPVNLHLTETVNVRRLNITLKKDSLH